MFVGLFVSACATTPQHQLSLAEIQSFAYVDTEVNVPDFAKIGWGRYQREQNRIAKGVPLDGSSLESANTKREEDANFAYTALFPAADQHREQMLIDPFKSSMPAAMGKLMKGDRQVKGIIEVNAVHIVSAAQTLLLGGSNSINASFRLVDVDTNATLATLPHATAIQTKGAGELGLILNELGNRNKYERTVDSYAGFVQKWLEKRGQK